MASSQHDCKIVNLDVKQQKNKTKKNELLYAMFTYKEKSSFYKIPFWNLFSSFAVLLQSKILKGTVSHKHVTLLKKVFPANGTRLDWKMPPFYTDETVEG